MLIALWRAEREHPPAHPGGSSMFEAVDLVCPESSTYRVYVISEVPEPAAWDPTAASETVFLTRSPAQTTDDGWLVSSLDVGSWLPLSIGERIVALDRDSHDEFFVEVTQVDVRAGEVFYRLRHLADLDPSATPSLDNTRTWLDNG